MSSTGVETLSGSDDVAVGHKRHIVFVDDEPLIRDDLKRVFRSMRNEWTMTFLDGGAAALDFVAEHHVDVIVSDLNMPCIDGVSMFRKVKDDHSHVIRIILSGQSKQDTAVQALECAHRYLSKPCDVTVLKSAIHNSLRLQRALANPALPPLLSGLTSIPTLPGIYDKIVAAAKDPSCSLETIGHLIAQDVGMTVEILKAANIERRGETAFTDPVEAVKALGADIVMGVVLNCHVLSTVSPELQQRFGMKHVLQHGFATGSMAGLIASEESSDPWLIRGAVTAGVLHDNGKLILAANLPEQYDEVVRRCREGQEEWVAETEVFGASHMEVGAYVLGLWGMPDDVVEAVAFHHVPAKSDNREISPLLIVHVANGLQRAYDSAAKGTPHRQHYDDAYLAECGWSNRVTDWEVA